MKKVFLPKNNGELWTCLDDHPRSVLYAGGTDVLVKLREIRNDFPDLICLERIEALQGIRDEDNTIWIGACTSHTRLLEDAVVQSQLPLLVKAVRGLGSPLIRNMGTIGGNICTASPAGDTLPPLYVLNAEVELRSKSGSRTLPIRDFIAGPGQTTLAPGEILTAVRVKKPKDFGVQHFEKVGHRNALACALASMAALLRVTDDGTIEKASLAWGSVGPTVVTIPEVDLALSGRNLNLETLQMAAAMVRRAVTPIDDIRADAEYRRVVSGNLLLRLAGRP